MVRSRFLLSVLLVIGSAACGDDVRPPPGGDSDSGAVRKDASAPDATGGPADVGFCTANPHGCSEGQRIGPAPDCTCLSACEVGYQWNGTGCTRSDAGTPADSGEEPDAGVSADATAPEDTGVLPGADATASDAVAATDAALNADAMPGQDGSPADATGSDAGLGLDASTADASPSADASAGDAARVDSGPRPDGGPQLFEGDECNPARNDCNGDPGMICQLVDTLNNIGLCLKTCDQANNVPGSTRNAACDGIGPNCLDFFDLGPASSRCLNAVGPFGELNRTVLDVCDPTIPNLFYIDPTGFGGACLPLCTVVRSTTQPVDVTCSGAFGACIDDPQERWSDNDGNVFGTCGVRVAREAHCAGGKGFFCDPADLCAMGLCRQRFGTTCTATTTCQGGQTCGVAGTAPNAVALCREDCDPLVASSCGAGKACALSVFGGQGVGSCRAQTGTVAAGSDCSDVLDFGTRATDCGQGTVCLPDSQDRYRQATCVDICNAAAPVCSANTNPAALQSPLDAYCVCL